jgi:hypothetical protein
LSAPLKRLRHALRHLIRPAGADDPHPDRFVALDHDGLAID